MTIPSSNLPKVLFVCAGNTCRSVLAEYIAKKNSGQLITPSSAGINPGTIQDAENAIWTLGYHFNIDAKNHIPRDVRNVDVLTFDLVVAMDNRVANQIRANFPALPPNRLLNWQIADPFGDNLEEYRECARIISRELEGLPMLKAQ